MERTYTRIRTTRIRTFSVKLVEYYNRNADGAMTKTLTAEDYDLPTDSEELAALHDLLGKMLGCCDEGCPCWIAGYEKGREYQP